MEAIYVLVVLLNYILPLLPFIGLVYLLVGTELVQHLRESEQARETIKSTIAVVVGVLIGAVAIWLSNLTNGSAGQ